MEFGQAYCQYLVTRILIKIMLYISKVYSIFDVF
jgi:hypothetical protein